jgi:energy-coupling factor transport system permease protein
MPVLEGALERSVELAAAMDARGFGRSSDRQPRGRAAGWLTGAGLLGTCVGVYGLLDASSPAVLGLPMLLAGGSLAVAGLAVGGRHATRSRYRPDPWTGPEWLVTGCGLVAAGTVLVAAGTGAGAALMPVATDPPTLPVVPALGVLAALLPAWLAPPVPRPRQVRTVTPRARAVEGA